MKLATLPLALLIALSLALAGCGGEDSDSGNGNGKEGAGSSSAKGADTPKAAFEAGKKAMEKEDMGAFYDVLDKESKEKMVGGAMMVASFSTMGENQEAKEKDFEAILEKHGAKKMEGEAASEEDMMKKMAEATSGVKDKRALVVALFEFAKKHGGETNDDTWVEVKDIKEEGEKAKGTLVTKKKSGNTKEEPIEFSKANGAWYIRIPE